MPSFENPGLHCTVISCYVTASGNMGHVRNYGVIQSITFDGETTV